MTYLTYVFLFLICLFIVVGIFLASALLADEDDDEYLF